MEEQKQQETGQEESRRREENAEWKNKARPAIYSMAGIYLVYLSYKMFKEISVTSGSDQFTMIVFSILFALIGAGGILFGLLSGYKNSKDKNDKENP